MRFNKATINNWIDKKPIILTKCRQGRFTMDIRCLGDKLVVVIDIK